jgi:hypothetical protein
MSTAVKDLDGSTNASFTKECNSFELMADIAGSTIFWTNVRQQDTYYFRLMPDTAGNATLLSYCQIQQGIQHLWVKANYIKEYNTSINATYSRECNISKLITITHSNAVVLLVKSLQLELIRIVSFVC